MLPFEQLMDYPNLFRELEKDPYIQSYNVNMTNLEEAFINFSKVQNNNTKSPDRKD